MKILTVTPTKSAKKLSKTNKRNYTINEIDNFNAPSYEKWSILTPNGYMSVIDSICYRPTSVSPDCLDEAAYFDSVTHEQILTPSNSGYCYADEEMIKADRRCKADTGRYWIMPTANTNGWDATQRARDFVESEIEGDLKQQALSELHSNRPLGNFRMNVSYDVHRAWQDSEEELGFELLREFFRERSVKIVTPTTGCN